MEQRRCKTTETSAVSNMGCVWQAGKKQNNEGSHEVTRHPRNLLFVKSFTCFFFTGKMDTRRGIVGTLKKQSWDQTNTSFPPKNQNKTKSQGFQSWGTFQLCKFWFYHRSKTNLCAIMALKLEKLVFCFVFYEKKKELQHLLLEQFFISLQTIHNPGNEQFSLKLISPQ